MKNSKNSILLLTFLSIGLFGCQNNNNTASSLKSDTTTEILTGGVKMIPVKTAKGSFNVWTKKVGDNPRIKVLLLHGGPGATHEYFECFDSFLPKEGIEYYYYDQLGSAYSDNPNDSSLWEIDRFVDEVESVRVALNLDASNFYLLGHSWGGILATEYALKYQKNLKGLVIANMMASAPAYNKYAEEVLGPQLDPKVFAQIKDFEAKKDYTNPKYTELLFKYYYTEHILRMPIDKWPESINRAFKHLNPNVYVFMQGPSEFGITGNATLKDWDVTSKLKTLTIPTLVIGAKYDTMDPKHMEWISKEVQNGRFLYCPNGSHCSQYDDQEHYFPGVISFLKDVDSGNFKKS